MKKALCNGIALKYHCIGEGSDIVMIHGLASSHAFWRINVLMALANRHRVTVYDLRGHGHSDMPESGYTVADMAEDLHGLLDHIGIEKAHLVGHSMGGAVALHYASLHPERVSSLVIADARVRAIQPSNYARDWPHGARIRAKLNEIGLTIPQDDPEAGIWLLEQIASPACRAIKDKFNGTPLFAPFFGWSGGGKAAQRWLTLLEKTTARKDFASPGNLMQDAIAAITIPMLAVYGEFSSALPSLYGLKRLLPQCKYVIIPGAGHFFPLANPAVFLNAVGPYLAQQEDVDMRRHIKGTGGIDVRADGIVKHSGS